MPKIAKELSAIQVKRLSSAGMHPVGGVAGLYLHVNNTGARSWVLRRTIHGKRREIGLGPYPTVTLALARNLAIDMAREIATGGDPLANRREEREARRQVEVRKTTFDDAFAAFYEQKTVQELGNAKHVKQWASTIATYASPALGSKAVADITLDDVLKVLTPIWTTKTETASRVRQRLEAVLDWARVQGLHEGENPARWKGNLDKVLPSPGRVRKEVSHPAVPVDDAARWFSALQAKNGIASRALQFLALTAARSGEIRGALWPEIDLEKRIWIVPALRMKAKKEHRVPLSMAAVTLLETTPCFEGSPFIFPADRGGSLSDMTLSAVMRRMQETEVKAGRTGFLDRRSGRPAVPHGLRSTFRDWAAERTTYPAEMAELALAHNIGSKVQQAYLRADMIERRRSMMEDWATWLCQCPAGHERT